MEDDLVNTIESLTTRANAKEEEANKLKKLVNELCGEAGLPIRYPTITESGSVSSIRSDQFYGLPLTAAIRNYLELRKASRLCAATVQEIFRAVKDGGYKFDTKNEDNARIGVGNALRKTSSIFHRLPNGQYGLLSWYPSARAPSIDEEVKPTKRGVWVKKKTAKTPSKKASRSETQDDGENFFSNKEIRDVIWCKPETFRVPTSRRALKASQPSKRIPFNKVATVIFLLKQKGLVKIAIPRSGKTGATFAKA